MGGLEKVSDGVWLLRGGVPRSMNAYLIEDEGGVTLFDTGVAQMAKHIQAAAAPLGGIRRVVLGHSHTDHRGSAPALGAPVYCHPDERKDAESDGGRHYQDPKKLPPPSRYVYGPLLRLWDGGPVKIEGTLEEGDVIAGFEVVHLPGHAPGQIALWRERDRLALSSDVFYTLDARTGFKASPRPALDAFSLDTEQARASIRKLAALEPVAAWPGHADPVVGDVRRKLEEAAER
ncbi:MAG TPA: MBL fold metallo-hydrolase [Actinomycetota bacterium]|nr:MBL fold metallo-hydrolase [Actinomycetota bacterium]